MSNDLVVKIKTELITKNKDKDFLSFYGIPEMLDTIVEKDRKDLLSHICGGAVIVDAINQIEKANGFSVEIPQKLREMIKTGEAHFDKSATSPGNFTANIRINGKKGIQGQATIYQASDLTVIANSISNLAMMAMSQSMLAKLEEIDEKLEVIIQGQKNDRIGKIVGAFEGFCKLYPTFKTKEEMRTSANQSFNSVNMGLTQIHCQIEADRKRLDNAPKNFVQSLFKGMVNIRNVSADYQKAYHNYIYDIQIYNRLILLADILLQYKGASFDNIIKNHRVMINYCDTYINDSLKKEMDYLMQSRTESIDMIMKQNSRIKEALLQFKKGSLVIEFKQNEVELLNIKQP